MDAARYAGEMRIALAVCLAASLASCSPLGVGVIVAGGATTGASVHELGKRCDGDGCAYGKVIGSMGLLVGLTLVAVGGLLVAV